jgi:Leucine-rich repeat (LRR) protein
MAKSIRPRFTHTAIPGDVVQGVLEYLAVVRDVLQCRCVCGLWQRAVSDAVGYINDRKWTRIHLDLFPRYLGQHFIVGFTQRPNPVVSTLVARFALACLWDRLESVHWATDWDPKPPPQVLPLQILGTSDCLTSLSLSGPFVRNVEILRQFTALTDLTIFGQRGMDSAQFFDAITGIKPLIRLHLRQCHINIHVDALRCCENLRTLDLSHSEMVDDSVAAALVRIPTLEALVLTCCSNVTTIASFAHDAETFACADSVHFDGSRTREPRSLTRIDLSHTRITDGSALAGMTTCLELKEIDLSSCPILDETLSALAQFPQLQKLRLHCCRNVHNVRALRHCRALRELVLSGTATNESADLRGLEEIGTLEVLDIQSMKVYDVDCLQTCPKLRSLHAQSTFLTNASLASLARIATLDSLYLNGCSKIDDASALADCPALRTLNLASTKVRNVNGLERITTLTSLSLSHCVQLVSVNTLSRCKGLLELDIRCTPAAADEGLRDVFADLPLLRLNTHN